MRLFIALDFNGLKEDMVKLEDKIDESLAKLKKVDAFHLTLKFLGKVSEEKAEEVKEKLKQIRFKPFSLTLDKIGVFPNQNFIRVIWIGVKESKEVIELQKQVEILLKDFKKELEFHPHITLARVKFVKDKEKFIKSLKEIKVEEKTIEVKDFRLVKSNLTPQGPIYEDIAIFPLS